MNIEIILGLIFLVLLGILFDIRAIRKDINNWAEVHDFQGFLEKKEKEEQENI